MERRQAEPTILDGLMADLGGPLTTAFLDKVEQVIDFEALAKLIRNEVTREQPKGGRPFWSVVVMIKCTMLAKWYHLSDPQLEEQLRDRLSFRRFVGLSLNDNTPDETTFVNFRKRLRVSGVSVELLFEGVLQQLRDRGLVLNEGSLVDATIIEQSKGKKNKAGNSTRDKSASFTQKHGQKHHGYKAHVNVSKDRFVTDYIFDTAKVHDSKHIDQLIKNEKKAVYADSAYMNQKRKKRLEDEGVHCGIVERRVRGQDELSDAQVEHNRVCSIVRALVEHPFGWMKQQMEYRRVRYRGVTRNAVDFALIAMAYNIKRSFSLLGLGLTALPSES